MAVSGMVELQIHGLRDRCGPRKASCTSGSPSGTLPPWVWRGWHWRGSSPNYWEALSHCGTSAGVWPPGERSADRAERRRSARSSTECSPPSPAAGWRGPCSGAESTWELGVTSTCSSQPLICPSPRRSSSSSAVFPCLSGGIRGTGCTCSTSGGWTQPQAGHRGPPDLQPGAADRFGAGTRLPRAARLRRAALPAVPPTPSGRSCCTACSTRGT